MKLSKYHSQLNCENNLGASNHHEQHVFYSVKTFKYNDSRAQNILTKTCQERNEQDEHDINLKKSSKQQAKLKVNF